MYLAALIVVTAIKVNAFVQAVGLDQHVLSKPACLTAAERVFVIMENAFATKATLEQIAHLDMLSMEPVLTINALVMKVGLDSHVIY